MSTKTRYSPSESATLYEIGTFMTGNDKNTWIVTQNKNGVKRWKLYVKQPTKEDVLKDSFSHLDLYDIPKIKQNDWKKWLENKNSSTKKIIEKLINLKKDLRKINIFLEFVGLPLSSNGIYWMDYPTDWLNEKYDIYNDDNSKNGYIVFIIKLDTDFHMVDEKEIYAHHTGITHSKKKDFIELMTKTFKDLFLWEGKQNKSIMIEL